jgi:hypothetical protein
MKPLIGSKKKVGETWEKSDGGETGSDGLNTPRMLKKQVMWNNRLAIKSSLQMCQDLSRSYKSGW